MKERIKSHLQAHQAVITALQSGLLGRIEECAQTLIDALRRGGKILIMGNGGSAADAQHMAAELVGRFLLERKALPAIALSTDTSVLTSVGNDYGFDEIFRRQVEALAGHDDVVIGISTSGQSMNVKRGLLAARSRGCRTIGLLGHDGGRIAPLCDLAVIVPAEQTPQIQEAHLVVVHLLCALVEEALCHGSDKKG